MDGITRQSIFFVDPILHYCSLHTSLTDRYKCVGNRCKDVMVAKSCKTTENHSRVLPKTMGVNTPNNNNNTHMTWTNTDMKQIVGSWYDRQPAERSEDISEAYQQIATINEAWFDLIPIEVEFVADDPYDNYAEMRRRVESENKLLVFDGGSEPKHMTKEQNIKGRAVHDFWGHLEADCDFSMRGELSKWYHVKDRYPQNCQPLLFTEIVGQRAAASYYGGGFGDDRFTQKAVRAPSWLIDLVCEFYNM